MSGRTHKNRNTKQFLVTLSDGREMTISIKSVERMPNADVRFDTYAHESDSYFQILSSEIIQCLNLKTGRKIKDLGKRYTIYR